MAQGNKWAAMLVVIIGTFMAILDGSIVNVALPKMMAVLNTTQDQIEWVLTAYMLTLGVVMPITGFLGDRFGSKSMYLLSLTCFTVGSAFCGLAWDVNSLIAARVIQGIGGGVLTPLGMAIIYKAFDRSEIGMALGIWGISAMAAPAIGPTLGGYIVEFLNWRLIFLINVPIGVLNVMLGWFLLRESVKVQGQAFDLVGLVTSVLGFSTLLYAISNGNSEGWDAPLIVGLLMVSAICLITLVVHELEHPEPILDFRLFRNPTFTLSLFLASINAMGLFGALFMIPFFLETLRGLSAMEVGMLLFPSAIASGIAMPISGWLFDRIGPKLVVTIGLIIVTLTTYKLSTLNLVTPFSSLMWWFGFRGLGVGLSMMPASTAGMNTVHPSMINRASALSNVIRQVAAAFGVALFSTIMQQREVFHFQHSLISVQMGGAQAFETMNAYSQTLLHNGYSPAVIPALSTGGLIGLIKQQALASAITDCFMVATLILASGIIPALFLKDVRRRPGAMAAKSEGSTAAIAAE